MKWYFINGIFLVVHGAETTDGTTGFHITIRFISKNDAFSLYLRSELQSNFVTGEKGDREWVPTEFRRPDFQHSKHRVATSWARTNARHAPHSPPPRYFQQFAQFVHVEVGIRENDRHVADMRKPDRKSPLRTAAAHFLIFLHAASAHFKQLISYKPPLSNVSYFICSDGW